MNKRSIKDVALHGKGFVARRLEEGFPEWRQAELPVERSD